MANPIASLHRAITTASNDDVSTIGSEERDRHVQRLDAMRGAVDGIERLRKCLEDTRNEICKGPVDDTLWHQEIPACTTVDNICMALDDDWDYDAWLAAQKEPKY